MRRTLSAGFTLIELLVVIAIISVLAVALLPNIVAGQLTGDITADRANLSWHYMNLQIAYKNRKLPAPPEGGHKFVLAPWILGVCEHTDQNRDRYFTPGNELDERWSELKEQDPKSIWKSYDEVGSEDTHYAGRARKHFNAGMWSGNEALMSDDNEFGPAFSDGTINVLLGDGVAKSLYRGKELDQSLWNDDDPDFVIEVGPNSPVELLQKLER